jgi:predicted RNA polymerase sigma factor
VPTDPNHAIDAVWRIESPRLIAGLARITGGIGLAEDFAQDALLVALEQWPAEGVPHNPGAWLMSVGKRRAFDHFRRSKLIDHKHEALAREIGPGNFDFNQTHFEQATDTDVNDDLLRLIFTACHPVLSVEARVALTLRLLGCLTTPEIARAFLAAEPTIAQRIVRAKRTLTDERIPFEVPRGADLASRLSSVLEVIYLIFNEGYSATAGDNWTRPALCDDALRLGRILAELAPREPEVHGFVGLMEIQASRLSARVSPSGEPILLADQNRALWNRLLIRRGLAAIDRAEKLGPAPGPYQLQAMIAACHAKALTTSETDWVRIAHLYAALAVIAPSPVVELNRSVAVAMAFGPQAGLEIADALLEEPSLRRYHLLPAVRGDFLTKLGRFQEARAEFEKAAPLTQNIRERVLLTERALALPNRD